jgi:hypothetical protein
MGIELSTSRELGEPNFPAQLRLERLGFEVEALFALGPLCWQKWANGLSYVWLRA